MINENPNHLQAIQQEKWLDYISKTSGKQESRRFQD